MHSSLVRIQSIFGFFTTVAAVVAALVAASVVLIPQAPTGNLTVRNLQVVKGRPHYYSTKKTEYASIRFDIDADLTSLFTWNTKQLFVWVTATYPSANSSSSAAAAASEAVIWDQIIPSLSQSDPPSVWDILPFPPPASVAAARKAKAKAKSPRASTPPRPGKISIRNVPPKYKISDPSGRIASAANVTLRLGYNVQPWVGALTWPQRGYDLFRWKALGGGQSKAFDLPAIKGATKDKEAVVGKGEVPRPGRAEPVVGA